MELSEEQKSELSGLLATNYKSILQGPQGPAGDTGPAGAVGPQGPAGLSYDTPASINFLKQNTMWCADGDLCVIPPGKQLRIPFVDTRSTNPTPDQWRGRGIGIYYDFKDKNAIGHDGCGQSGFAIVKTIVPWPDTSGGVVSQYAYAGGCVRLREEQNGGSWWPWKKLDQN
jgi:hypothetical protein